MEIPRKEKKQPWYKKITVEPVMFFYMMAFMITSVIEQTFYVFRACTVNHGYSEEICYNISSYSDVNIDVQDFLFTFGRGNFSKLCTLSIKISLAFTVKESIVSEPECLKVIHNVFEGVSVHQSVLDSACSIGLTSLFY
ncbi:jg2149 [Pararge aegeria aegeria]|uniref:Jg2149 protein n=1 Tax=Pararge aegeria aegeria TaxID=348720 RepID=A0A8S4QT14_9NEOP|nr:jg2149 [Pararge aegeria aegeria]